MKTAAGIKSFLEQELIAVYGVSRSGKKFGNIAYKGLKAKGYRVRPVHPKADQVEGDKCYSNLSEIEELPGAALIVLSPEQTERALLEVADVGIKNVWIQQGAESDRAIRFCEDKGLNAIHGECILMFADPKGFHKFHRWIWGLLGKLPE